MKGKDKTYSHCYKRVLSSMRWWWESINDTRVLTYLISVPVPDLPDQLQIRVREGPDQLRGPAPRLGAGRAGAPRGGQLRAAAVGAHAQEQPADAELRLLQHALRLPVVAALQ
jgi:hypothetical protein